MTEQEIPSRILEALGPVIDSFPKPSLEMSKETNRLMKQCYNLLVAAAKHQQRLAKKAKA